MKATRGSSKSKNEDLHTYSFPTGTLLIGPMVHQAYAAPAIAEITAGRQTNGGCRQCGQGKIVESVQRDKAPGQG